MKETIMLLYSSATYNLGYKIWENQLLLETPEGPLISFPLAIQLESLSFSQLENISPEMETVFEPEISIDTFSTHITFNVRNSNCDKKAYHIICREDSLSFYATVTIQSGKLDRLQYFYQPSATEYTSAQLKTIENYYVPRFDWSCGKVYKEPGTSDSISCQQWLSPGPFFYGIKQKESQQWYGIGVEAQQGSCNFISYDWKQQDTGFTLELTYEGHTNLETFCETPHLLFTLHPDKEENNALKRYVSHLIDASFLTRKVRTIPSWWREPIFCGWGQQRFAYRKDHDGHENGNWINAGDYATETFYRNQLQILDQQGVNPGIVIVDCFWAEKPIMAKPHPLKWHNMRKFIDEQHDKGRKVLLWYTPILFEGLPLEACMTLQGQPIAADPTSPAYKKILQEQITLMISSDSGCLNADGFKIDFTQNIPSERGQFRNILKSRWALLSEDPEKIYPVLQDRNDIIQTFQPVWGLELIRSYLLAVREPMKKVKADSLLITHTANPFLSEEVDMLRLNDMDGISPDVLGIMKNRAEIALSCNPQWLIDTDNDLMTCKDMWKEYMQLQRSLGNPDTYYANGIAQSPELFTKENFALLKKVFPDYL